MPQAGLVLQRLDHVELAGERFAYFFDLRRKPMSPACCFDFREHLRRRDRKPAIAARPQTRRMRFPIDVVYLDGDKVVIHLEENLKPWRLAPVRLRAASVLELPDRTLSSTQTAIGDRIEISLGKAGEEGSA